MGDLVTDSALDANLGQPVAREARRNNNLRWLLSVGAATMLAVASVLMFLLALATNNQTRFEQYYERLLIINVSVAAVFLLVIAWVVWRLVSRLRRGKFGSRLLIKLAAIFALVGFLPGMLIYTVSYQFVSRSIESWFNVKVEGALDAGLSLGRGTIDSLSSDLANKTRAAAQQLSEAGSVGPLALERLREQLGARDVVLWSSAGQVLASAGESRFSLTPERPTASQLRQARSTRVVSQVEGLEEAADKSLVRGAHTGVARIRALAWVGNSGIGALGSFGGAGPSSDNRPTLGTGLGAGLGGEARFLQVTQEIPPALVANALAVQEAYQEYQQRALAREGLQKMYLATLTLSLFLAMFGAVLLAAVLGNQLVRPLLVLADGVAQVAAGDLRPKAALQTRDELGGLTRSFAQMTQQLSDARTQLQSSLGQLDASRSNLQTILDNLTAGVIVLDAQGRLVQANPGASRVLHAPLAAYMGQSLQRVQSLQSFADSVEEQFRVFLSERNKHLDHWQHSFELGGLGNSAPSFGGNDSSTSIIARGAALPGDLRLLVLDDITEVVSAQRSRAWGEVARRLAHEIKNPLTPIQLSAERLEMKLLGKLAAPDDALLVRSVKTIVDQVDAMKRLVNEFRDYARLPSAELKTLDINALVTDVMALYAPENATVPVTPMLDPNCPPILGDAQQLRQVIHNLLQNAQDASLTVASGVLAEHSGRPAQVVISTRFNPASRRVRLAVSDSGTGFAPHILQRAFEPYVTTKSRGTGLGLAVVKKIADEHNARIELTNLYPENEIDSQVVTNGGEVLTRKAIGARVSLSFPVV